MRTKFETAEELQNEIRTMFYDRDGICEYVRRLGVPQPQLFYTFSKPKGVLPEGLDYDVANNTEYGTEEFIRESGKVISASNEYLERHYFHAKDVMKKRRSELSVFEYRFITAYCYVFVNFCDYVQYRHFATHPDQ